MKKQYRQQYKRLPTVTVAVAAFNEEKNIIPFLSSVLAQKEEGLRIVKILVVSDGSSDRTEQVVKSMHNPKIKLVSHKERRGHSARLSEIYASVKTDFLVKSDADVVFDHAEVVSSLLKPLIESSKVGMASGQAIPLSPETSIEKAIHLTRNAYEEARKVNGGDNKFTVQGRIMALRREVAKSVKIPSEVVGNDAFTYFASKAMGFGYAYVPEATVVYRSPQTVSDHIRQNTRFLAAPLKMENYFGSELVRAEYSIPKLRLIRGMLGQFVRHPLLSVYIYSINLYCAYLARKRKDSITGKWTIAASTKSTSKAEAASTGCARGTLAQGVGKGRIDVVVKYFYPVAAGIEHNIAQTYKVLAKRGWQVTIHTSADTLTSRNVLPAEEEILGMKVVRYPFGSETMGYAPKIDWENTDLVCLHNFNVFYWRILLHCALLKLVKRKKFALVITPHGGFTPEWSLFSFIVKLRKIPYHFVFGPLLMNYAVDAVRAVSEWEREQIIAKRVSSAKVFTISNGLDDEAFMDVDKLVSPKVRRMVKSWGRYLFQLGRIYPIKNFETAIRALALVPDDVKFVIGGPIADEKYLTSLKQLAKSLGVADRVIFLGTIWGVDKFYVIKHASLMVHMALWESFCNIVHEGMSQGLVCLVANNTALPYLVKDKINGYCLPTRDHMRLASKINYVLASGSNGEIAKIKANNLQFGQQTSWKMVALRMEKLYQSL